MLYVLQEWFILMSTLRVYVPQQHCHSACIPHTTNNASFSAQHNRLKCEWHLS